jgi:adenylylsulfate kinase-like enzyme
MLIWITGLSGSGKSTIGKLVYEHIKKISSNTVFLDGDVIRNALDNNYGHTLEGRLRGAKQVSGLCKMLDKEGINVVCSTMSLFKEIQESNRREISQYLEVFLNVDIQVLKARDSKKVYSSNIENVVGIDLPYHAPSNPELILDNSDFRFLDSNIGKILKFFSKIERQGSGKQTSVGFWEEYYASHQSPSDHSPFAKFVFEYLPDAGSLLELGCGNGRDSVFFSGVSDLNIIAIDQCETEIDFLNKNYGGSKLNFKVGDFSKLDSIGVGYNCIYSRFTMHSIDEESEERVLDWVSKSLLPKGLFFLEARSVKDEIFGEGSRIGNNEYYTDHYRRFLDFETIKE